MKVSENLNPEFAVAALDPLNPAAELSAAADASEAPSGESSAELSELQALRFGGVARLYGQAFTQHLLNAHLVVIGLGGVGSWVAEALVRTAVGEITLIDLDDICISNTNRQIQAMQSTIGQSKAEVLAARLRDIHPDCKVHIRQAFVHPDNLQELIPQQADYVIDAIDTVRDKAALIAWCRRRKLPILTIGGAGGQIDPTRIRIDDLSRTQQDPLAAKLRSVLKRHHGFSKTEKFGVDCVYSTEQLRYPQADGRVCMQKPQGQGSIRLDCSGGFGASTSVTGSFAFFAVAQVLKKMQARWQRQQLNAAEANESNR